MTDGINIYKNPLNNCPLCGSDNIGFLYNIPHPEYPFSVSRCGSCRFIFMNPRFMDDVIKSFYGKNYYQGSASYSFLDERKIEKFSAYAWNARIKTIQSYKKTGRFLDVGCSFGGFLEQAKKYYAPYGIEYSSHSGSFAKTRFGNSIHIGTLNDHPYPRHFFSVITMIELIEHLEHPFESLSECHRLLEPGGVLVIQTADMAGWQARIKGKNYGYYLPGHLSYFTQNNLSQVLKKIGFDRIRTYHPTDFGCLPKLLKSRGSFTSPIHYFRWLRITVYHLMGKIHGPGFKATSSMVIYAIKQKT